MVLLIKFPNKNYLTIFSYLYFKMLNYMMIGLLAVAEGSTRFTDNTKYYNILAIDGGGIRGLIPAKAIQYMEKYAFDYCTSKGYDFPKYLGNDGKTKSVVALKDMFDMMAGTSTGSIITAALSYPTDTETAAGHKIPKFFADEVIGIYENNGDRIFTSTEYGPDSSA